MKLIIDIDDETYNSVCNGEMFIAMDRVANIIKYGIPLEEPFINKPCISEEVCHEDKIKVLDKIGAEIEDYCKRYNITFDSSISACIDIIDKYREER